MKKALLALVAAGTVVALPTASFAAESSWFPSGSVVKHLANSNAIIYPEVSSKAFGTLAIPSKAERFIGTITTNGVTSMGSANSGGGFSSMFGILYKKGSSVIYSIGVPEGKYSAINLSNNNPSSEYYLPVGTYDVYIYNPSVILEYANGVLYWD
ncbi:hypothetical protein [Tumebacillus lipolyticus]|uniref:Uncharacterized protein n=1 Tax=Tumebacillus lipolyticus TaxID=1280370 RepID=A0ABW4ZT56_9BACL